MDESLHDRLAVAFQTKPSQPIQHCDADASVGAGDEADTAFGFHHFSIRSRYLQDGQRGLE
jgi:hypothetical protein